MSPPDKAGAKKAVKVLPGPIRILDRAGRVGATAGRGASRGTLSGTLIKQTSATTTWFLYPGACAERALGTWSAKSSPVADSLQPTTGFPNSTGYTDNQPDIGGGNNTIAYTREDLSLSEQLWHVVAASTPAAERPAIIDGTRSLWCGKFDSSWPLQRGYPNNTFQILYIDTGAHAGSYDLTFQGNFGAELGRDFLTILGGGGTGDADPLGNNRSHISGLLPPWGAAQGGPFGDSQQIVSFTGSLVSTQFVTANTGPDLVVVEGAASGPPGTVSFTISGIPAGHRALYLVFQSQSEISSADGLWPHGDGPVIDLVNVSDNGSVYNDQAAAGGSDPHMGSVLAGLYGSFGCVSSRVPPGLGELWQLAPGNENLTADACWPQKTVASDLFFEGGDPTTNQAINGQFNSIVTCTFPVPPGTASVLATWTEYMDLPPEAGYGQLTEYRCFKDGSWSPWKNTNAGGGVVTGALREWTTDGAELVEAVQADSVQLRFGIQCIPALAADGVNCSWGQTNALLYDDLNLQATTGVPAPIFGIFPASVAQTTFVDGTMTGTNCATIPCWPGIRGSDLGTPGDHNIAIHDNWNSPLGDSITLSIVTGLRQNGMGVNWRRGFDKSIGGGEVIAHTNGAYNSSYDFPRMIFRLYDPATKTWGPLDSTELIADAVAIADPDGGGSAPPETTVIDSEYRMNWPPYDKLETGATLPGGFTINGVGNYANLRFLPRGTRMQYYFKAVDISGSETYTFSTDALSHEAADLPQLPGSGQKAPDIIQFEVLPGVYPTGSAGSLLAGKSNTPLLSIEGAYTAWGLGYDPVNWAFRAMGVRADRYRLLQGDRLGANIGGRTLPGQRPATAGDYFPNMFEYSIEESLNVWYSILLAFSQFRTTGIFGEPDARLARLWFQRDRGYNGGDRGLYLYGDNFGYSLTHPPVGETGAERIGLASALGVVDATDGWAGAATRQRLYIDDRWSGPGVGPNFGSPLSNVLEHSTLCVHPSRVGTLLKESNPRSQPVEVGVSGYASETYSIRFAERNWLSLSYMKGGVTERAVGVSLKVAEIGGFGINLGVFGRLLDSGWGKVPAAEGLRKDITEPKGSKRLEGNPPDTTACFPCPSDRTFGANWATAPGFARNVYGPLYAIQDPAIATGVPVAPAPAPRVTRLDGNAPNPFNPATRIRFQSAMPGRLTVRIFSVGGRVVRILSQRLAEPGPGEALWDGKSGDGQQLSSGVYFYSVQFPDGTIAASRMVLLK